MRISLHIALRMSTYKPAYDQPQRCLRCGDECYGRTDKTFCSQTCKDKYHYERKASVQRYRRRILIQLEKNYEILCNLLDAGRTCCELYDMEEMGFRAGTVTGYRRCSNRHTELRCFDIKFLISDTRIFKIERIETKIPPGTFMAPGG